MHKKKLSKVVKTSGSKIREISILQKKRAATLGKLSKKSYSNLSMLL
jgi:hypothetical protein